MMSEDPTFKEDIEDETPETQEVAVAEAIRVLPSSSSTDTNVTTEEKQQEPTTTTRSGDPLRSETIRIVSIQDNHLPQVCDLLKEAFQSKRCLMCLPVDESLDELRQRYEEMPDAKRKLGAVAINDKNNVMGHVQMTRKGLPVYPEDFHTCQRDEMYIEIIAVSPEARGLGIGTRLLEWCQGTALEHSKISRLQLEVLRGNRAIGLYERFGFDIKPLNDCMGECCGAILVCCFFGRPYGLCHKEWGSVEMEMLLEKQG